MLGWKGTGTPWLRETRRRLADPGSGRLLRRAAFEVHWERGHQVRRFATPCDFKPPRLAVNCGQGRAYALGPSSGFVCLHFDSSLKRILAFPSDSRDVDGHHDQILCLSFWDTGVPRLSKADAQTSAARPPERGEDKARAVGTGQPRSARGSWALRVIRQTTYPTEPVEVGAPRLRLGERS